MSNITKLFLGICFLMILIVVGGMLFLRNNARKEESSSVLITTNPTPTPSVSLAITAMRQKKYPGSDITIEQQLPDGSNYHQYLTSYMADGLKIYALLTVPFGQRPTSGWPVILFNHGYIDPSVYQTFPSSGQYASYYPYFAHSGYIVFKPDYRGNGNSQGQPEGAYYSPAYATDDLNALASIKKYKDANPNKIGIWGHSMGGNITLRDLVVDPKDVKAAVIWGGVVGSYSDLFFNWQRKVPFQPGPRELALRNNARQQLVSVYGNPKQNPAFWDTLDPTKFLQDITVPIQIHVGSDDEEVPVVWSQSLFHNLQAKGKTVAYYEYSGDNHNISAHVDLAMERSLAFFDKYLK